MSIDCPHDSLSGDEGSIAALGRMPHWWRCDTCNAVVYDRDFGETIANPPCGCPRDPYHRWNCTLTPIWAQTIRDLDTNPWTVLEAETRFLSDHNPRRFPVNCFVWNGETGRYCGRGPCCMFDGHDGRCRM